MRLAKLILTGLCAAMALMAGLVAAAIGVLGIALFALIRLFRRPTALRRPTNGPRRPAPASRGDAIDVTATEVPPERIGR